MARTREKTFNFAPNPINSMATTRKAAIGFIFITLLIDIMGWGLIIPVMPKLIEGLKNVPANEASTYGGWLLTAYALTQFVFAPVIGNLSDRYGRRPVLLSSLLGFGIDYLFLAYAPNYGLLFIGRTIAGITGASFTTASAYIADISTPETRAKNFGMIGAAFGIGFILGPVLGGLVSSAWGIRAPFITAAVLCFVNFLYGFFVLPESLSKENRRPFEWKKANPFGSLQLFKKYPAIGGLAVSFFLIYLAAQAVQGNWNYFTAYRFKWDEKMIGISLGVVGALIGVVQGVLTGPINKKLGGEKSVYLGLILYTIGLALFAFATQSWMMFAFLVPYCLGGLAGPALQAILAGHIPPNEQGALQGALTSLMSLTTVIGPLVMTGLFKYFTSDKAPIRFPGIPFLLGAVLMLISTIIAWYVLSSERKKGIQVREASPPSDVEETVQV
jgi:DHA1 family tetracycline resistance protein-like MFS transporter